MVDPCCTTQQSNTHITDTLEVRYPWHPWYGRELRVQTTRVRNGPTVCRCTTDDGSEFPVLEIPQWMFDACICARMEISEAARVDCEALYVLKTLLDSSAHGRDRVVVEAQHHSLIGGGADAKGAEIESPANGVVPAATQNSGIESGNPPKDREVADANAVRTRRKMLRFRRQGGGQ